MQKKFEKLDQIISPEYKNQFGDRGAAGFQKSIIDLEKSFTNAHWSVEEIISDGNKAVVKQNFTGTQTKQFQNIVPTNKSVSVDGIATYGFKEGKIIDSHIQTDRLAFMQQLGVIPLSAVPENENTVYFVDKFFVPANSIDAFNKQMKYNRAFATGLSGYIRGEAFEKKDNVGNLIIMTIAIWENQEKLNEAKEAVQREFKRIGFNPREFYQRLNVKMEREQYNNLKE